MPLTDAERKAFEQQVPKVRQSYVECFHKKSWLKWQYKRLARSRERVAEAEAAAGRVDDIIDVYRSGVSNFYLPPRYSDIHDAGHHLHQLEERASKFKDDVEKVQQEVTRSEARLLDVKGENKKQHGIQQVLIEQLYVTRCFAKHPSAPAESETLVREFISTTAKK